MKHVENLNHELDWIWLDCLDVSWGLENKERNICTVFTFVSFVSGNDMAIVRCLWMRMTFMTQMIWEILRYVSTHYF